MKSEAKKRKVHTPEFKAKVGLEASQGVKTVNFWKAVKRIGRISCRFRQGAGIPTHSNSSDKPH
jgi:hypothetical protein